MERQGITLKKKQKKSGKNYLKNAKGEPRISTKKSID